MAATVKPHTLTLTRGALTLIEGCLSDPGPCDTPAKIAEWADAQKKLRAANTYKVATPWGAQRIDKPVLLTDEEQREVAASPAKVSATFEKRATAYQDEIVKAWQDTPVIIRISDKFRECLRAAMKYVLEHQADQKARIRVDVNEYWSQAFIALGLPAAKDLPEDDGFEVVAEDEPPKTLAASA